MTSRQFSALYRLPILALHATVHTEWFTGEDEGYRLSLIVSAKHRDCGRATIDDAYVLSFVAGRIVQTDETNGSRPPAIFIHTAALLEELGMPVGQGEIARVWMSMRRLASTHLHVNRDDKTFGLAPLLDVQPDQNGDAFSIAPSEYLVDEVRRGQIMNLPNAAVRYGGWQARLFGWAETELGREHDSGRFISQAECMARAGAIGSIRRLWSELRDVVARTDIPGFVIGCDHHGGEPGLVIHRSGSLRDGQRRKSIDLCI